MVNQMTITRSADNYRQGINALGLNIGMAAWSKGQVTLTQEKGGDMFRNDEEDYDGQNEGQGVAIGNQMISKASIM